MNVTLTDEQTERIALSWIAAQHRDIYGAKQVINALFHGAHMATWSWLDLLKYAVKLCSKDYCMSVKHILEELK